MGQSATDDDGLRVVCVNGHLQQFPDMGAHLMEYLQSLGITVGGFLGERDARVSCPAAQKQTAGVVFKVSVLIGYGANFSCTCVGAAIELTIDDDAHAQSCTNGDSHKRLEVSTLTIVLEAERKAVDIVVDSCRYMIAFSISSLRCTSCQEGMLQTL